MKRRGNSEGCITKDSRGKWIARLQIGYNSNGNPRIKTFSGNTPTEARRRMNNFKKNLTNMDGLTKADGLMSEGLRYWSDKYKKPTLKPSSYDRLMQTIEYQIIPYIGNYMIQKVSTDDIQESIINRMQKQGLSHSSIKKAYEALNGFFRQYVVEQKIVFNPMVGVILPSKSQFNTKQLQVLSGDEMKKFVSVAAEKLKKGECRYRYGYGLIFVLYTGLREGDDDDKIRLNQRKPSKYKGLRRFGPEKNLQRINKFMKERPIFYKNLIQMKENIRFYLRCFYCITKVMILQFNSENRTELARNG